MLLCNPESLIEKYSHLFVDVGTLSNHVKSVSLLSLNLSLFDPILLIIIVCDNNKHFVCIKNERR
jgi:hypothetical protein